MIRHAQITSADAYLDDNTLFGVVEEFKIPSIEHGEVEHNSLGSVATLKLPSRPVQPLDGSIKFKIIEPEIARDMINPGKVLSFQLHSKIDVYNEDGYNKEQSKTLVTHVKANFKKVEYGDSKQGEAQGLTGEFTAQYLMQKLYDENTPIVEIDVFNNIFKTNGEAVWA